MPLMHADRRVGLCVGGIFRWRVRPTGSMAGKAGDDT